MKMEKKLVRAFKKMKAEEDLHLVDSLIELGYPEHRALAIIGNMNCPDCAGRLIPISIIQNKTMDLDIVTYVCCACKLQARWSYIIKNKMWRKGWPRT